MPSDRFLLVVSMPENTMHQKIYAKLREVARSGRLITYGELAPLANLDLASLADRTKLANILGEISTHEHEQNRPLLSAVVVLGGESVPGEGFFKLARDLGVHTGGNPDQNLAFFVREINRVYAEWA
jgi:hypothetical protein